MGNPILEALEFDEERGAISFKGVRYLLIRPETLVEFQNALEARLEEEAQELLYHGGLAGGHLSTKKYKKAFGYGAEEVVQFMMTLGGQIGLNSPKIPALFPCSSKCMSDTLSKHMRTNRP